MFPVQGKPQLSTRIFGVLIEPRDRQLLCRSNGHGGEGRGKRRGGGAREEWQSRRDYPHEVHGKKTQYCLGLILERTALMDGAISRVHLRNIFFLGPVAVDALFEKRGCSSVHVPTFKRSYILGGFSLYLDTLAFYFISRASSYLNFIRCNVFRM